MFLAASAPELANQVPTGFALKIIYFSSDTCPACHSGVSRSAWHTKHRLACLLAERERKDLDTGIEEFKLKNRIFDRPLLPDELIHPGLSNLACAIGRGIGSMIVAGRGAVHL